MLVKVHAFQFAFLGDAKPAEQVQDDEDDHGDDERGAVDAEAADALGFEDLPCHRHRTGR